ncbi:MAG: hypothetical protein ACFFBE_08160 [Promethearchaeota archaeon]
MLELKELAEKKEFVLVKRYKDIHNGEKLNQNMRDLHLRMIFNHRYYEEKEKLLINLDFLREYYSIGQIY